VRLLSGILLVFALLCSCANAAEEDWGAPAPDLEIERANLFLTARLGQKIFDQSLKVVASGLINSGGELTGYFVCYHFCPRSVVGIYATICVERAIGEEYHNSNPGEIPNCGENPEFCEVKIGIAEALQVALDNGYRGELRDASIRLWLYPEYKSFVWRIDEKPDGSEAYNSQASGFRYFLINARTGAIEKNPWK